MATVLVSLFVRCAYAVPFEDVQALLGRYCVDCHAGDDAESGMPLIRIQRVMLVQSIEKWRILRQVQGRAMPPDDVEQPSDEKESSLHSGFLMMH